MRSIICTAVIGILATVASANSSSCSAKCSLDYSTKCQNAKGIDDTTDCALKLNECLKACHQI